jgi:hypothetical protein
MARLGRLVACAGLLAIVIAGCGSDGDTDSPSPLPPAPAGVTDGCREAAEVAGFEVLCPSGWPQASRPARVRLRLYEDAGSASYLLEEQDGLSDRAPVFHVLFGGQRKPFPAGFEGGGGQLRLTTRRVVTPYYASPKGGRVLGRTVVERPTRRVGTTTVRDQRAAIMQAPPFPAGGIHGGHTVVMWNEGGHGYLVSTHSETSRRAATRAALQIARSSEPVADQPSR